MARPDRTSTVLRRLLAAPDPIVAPCAFDCISARVVELAGFPVVMQGGFNTAASVLGIADVGTISQTEMMAAAGYMSRAVDIPVLCDVDDGFGKQLNVARTVMEAIRAGTAGMYMEDQVLPKRCPSLGGGGVVTKDEMIGKIQAARQVTASLDPDFVLIARTHAGRALNLKEGLHRGQAYARAGADLIWVDLGYDESVYDELKAIVDHIAPYAPVIANMTENVGRPMLTTNELHKMGFKVIAYPLTLILTAAAAMTNAMTELANKGTTRDIVERMMPVKKFSEIVKMEDIHEFERHLEQHRPT